jgi:hypothetical protein
MTRWFRKHSKILMVFLAVFAMAIFGLGDAVMQFTRGGATPNEKFKDEVVATWGANQEIKQSDLGLMLERHYQVQRFLQKVVATAEAAKKDYRPLAPMIPPIQGDERASRSMVNEQLVERFILARKAEKEGLIYTDAMVDDYLDLLSGQFGFSKLQLTQLNREANPGRASYEVVRRHLRQELMAQQMRILSNAGFQMVANPTEGAELYQQYSERVQCDVMPVSVDQFANTIASAPVNELKKLYDEGKFEYPDPTGKRPGFKRPNRVAVQYIMADNETFTQNEINKLTAEQVQAEYDRLVAAKDNLVMEDVPAEETPASQPNSSETPQAPASSETPNSDVVPATPEQNKPEAPPASEPVKTEESAPAAPAEEKKDGVSSSNRSTINAGFQYVSFHQDENQPQAPKEESPSTEPEAPKQEPTTGSEEPTPPTTPAPTEDQAAANVADPAAANPQPAAATPQSEGENLFSDDKKPERRVRPLVDVADKIKRNLVRDAVKANIEKAIKSVEEQLELHQSDLMAWEVNDAKTRGAEPKIDYQEIAKGLGLVAGETELMDYNAFSQTALGKSMFPINSGGQFNVVTIAQRIFGDYDRLNENYSERQVDFLTQNQYVFWLNEKQDAASVSFEECQEEVEKFWKQSRMVEEAVKKAQTIADEINNSKSSLKEKYSDKVTSTGEFAWFNTTGQPGYGQPLGVNNPGADFMKSVFALETKQTGVAVNADRSVVFVVQMISERKPFESLGIDYVENQYLPKKFIPGEIGMLMQQYAQEYNLDWNQEFQDEMGLKFLGR